MAGWKTNPVMEWSDDGTTWHKISDHGRDPLSISFDRIENKQRMANGTMRKYVVAKKRTFTLNWTNLPSKIKGTTLAASDFLANGETGQWIDDWHRTHDGAFWVRLRAGSDITSTNPADNITDNTTNGMFKVMISDYSKEIAKRGPVFDLWNIDITLEEC